MPCQDRIRKLRPRRVECVDNAEEFMKRLAKRLDLWLLPICLSAGQARYARLGDFEGAVQVQLQAADDWQPARRNLPLRGFTLASLKAMPPQSNTM